MNQNSKQQPLRILLAEDNADLRSALKELLRREGFVVFEAATGLAALEIIRRERVTFSIMDVDMPGLTGFEVLKIVRTQLGGALPCIFMSGDGSRERQMKALEVGAFSLLEKPIVPDLLRFWLAAHGRPLRPAALKVLRHRSRAIARSQVVAGTELRSGKRPRGQTRTSRTEFDDAPALAGPASPYPNARVSSRSTPWRRRQESRRT